MGKNLLISILEGDDKLDNTEVEKTVNDKDLEKVQTTKLGEMEGDLEENNEDEEENDDIEYNDNEEEPEDEEDLDQNIIDFFIDNPEPEDEEVHDFAEELDMEPDELEKRIYGILGNLLRNVGKHRDSNIEDFDEDELRMGMEVEMEHTDDPYIALELVKDHLSEIKNYYTLLKAMEEKAKAGKN